MPVQRKTLGLLAWITILFLMELFVLATMLPMDLLQKAGETEHDMTVRFLGDKAAQTLKSRTDSVYDAAFNKTGAVRESFRMFIPSAEEQAKSRGLEKMGAGMFKYVEGRLFSFWTAMYLAVHRVLSLAMWLPGFVPVLAVAIYDGLVTRRIRMLTFGTSSAMAFGTAKTTMLALFVGPVIYALFPFPIPPIVAPLWCGSIVIAATFMASNWPRN